MRGLYMWATSTSTSIAERRRRKRKRKKEKEKEKYLRHAPCRFVSGARSCRSY
jgi:hypothetical protein